MTTATINFVLEECHACSMPFQVTEAFQQARMDDGENFYCPAGHGERYSESNVEKLEKKLERQERITEGERRMRHASRDRADQTARSNAALRGHLTRAKNRKGEG